ncbi:hypothetical protein CEXT_380871 [Caerostris extrusa]|uniref:Uncharacterized protein n=1 Tax=Caerostris extrusa TaxID=172846 RepID=A0AAV4PKV6_CAEEX|nr:hypothetical protein CEXT_380871 [Caerostris extrusa]
MVNWLWYEFLTIGLASRRFREAEASINTSSSVVLFLRCRALHLRTDTPSYFRFVVSCYRKDSILHDRQDVDEDEKEGVVTLPRLIGQVEEAGQPGDLTVGTLQCVVEGSGRVQKERSNVTWDDPDYAPDSFGPGFRLLHAGFQLVKHCHVSEMEEGIF